MYGHLVLEVLGAEGADALLPLLPLDARHLERVWGAPLAHHPPATPAPPCTNQNLMKIGGEYCPNDATLFSSKSILPPNDFFLQS